MQNNALLKPSYIKACALKASYNFYLKTFYLKYRLGIGKTHSLLKLRIVAIYATLPSEVNSKQQT